MKKSDLKLGWILEREDGEMYVNAGVEWLANNNWTSPNNYDNNLIGEYSGLKIMNVYELNPQGSLGFSLKVKNKECLKLIWEREPKIELNETEKQFLNILDDKWKYIVRDKDELLYLYDIKPQKLKRMWDDCGTYIIIKKDLFKDHIFEFITFEDEEPTLLVDLKERCE